MSLFNRNQAIDSRIFIEQRGEGRINRLTQAATSKSTLQKVLELAWTAGPVTLIASIGGYYMGHGKSLPKETLVFFIAYTVIAGVIGLIAHIFNRLTRDDKQELLQSHLAQVIGGLPDRIIELRDLYLSTLTPEMRQLEAARILLEDVDLGPRWYASAVRSCGGSARLCNAAEEIDIYRRAGMNQRCEDLMHEHWEELEQLVEQLRPQAPKLADSLLAHFRAERPNLREGVQRTAYFIERIFAAIDDDDDSLITLEDVEEMYTLMFELLCGRSIPVLTFNYVGNWQLARATDSLEKERLKFRIARAQSYSRLLALASHLYRFSDQEGQHSIRGLTGPQLLAYCTDQIEQLVERLNDAQASRAKGEFTSRRRMTHNRWVLEKSLELYQQAFAANGKTDREYANLQKDIERWKKKIAGLQHQEVEIHNGNGGRGLQIIEDRVYLHDKSKVAVVEALYEEFHELDETIKNQDTVSARIHAAKQLAIHIALELDRHIGISRPEVQRAIYNANTLHMGPFESNLSTKTKIGWGEALAKEIRKDMARASEALVKAIYRFYGLRLNSEAQELLVERYGAKLDRLNDIYQQAEERGSVPHDQLPIRPFQVPKPPLAWRLALGRPGPRIGNGGPP